MAINFSKKAPKDGLARIASHLSQSTSIEKSATLAAKSAKDVSVSQAVQIWTTKLDEVDKGITKTATAGDWQYLIFENGKLTAGAHLSDEPEADEISAMSYGPMVSGILEGFNAASTLKEIESFNVEPRLLVIPSIPFAALWLHDAENPQHDFVIPIPPSATSFKNYEPITLASLEKELQKEAAIIRSHIEANPGDSGGSGGFVDASDDALKTVTIPSILSLTKVDVLPSIAKAKTLFVQIELPYFMQPQQQTNWCWSAVGTSVGLFYRTGNWTQCNTASGCLPGKNCCKNPAPCNVYGYLNLSLTYTKSYNKTIHGRITLQEIQKQLSAGNPVGTRIAWFGGGAHFNVITGVNGNNITIQDPIFGRTVIAYNNYGRTYHGGGTWTHTYLCQRMTS